MLGQHRTAPLQQKPGLPGGPSGPKCPVPAAPGSGHLLPAVAGLLPHHSGCPPNLAYMDTPTPAAPSRARRCHLSPARPLVDTPSFSGLPVTPQGLVAQPGRPAMAPAGAARPCHPPHPAGLPLQTQSPVRVPVAAPLPGPFICPLPRRFPQSPPETATPTTLNRSVFFPAFGFCFYFSSSRRLLPTTHPHIRSFSMPPIVILHSRHYPTFPSFLYLFFMSTVCLFTGLCAARGCG